MQGSRQQRETMRDCVLRMWHKKGIAIKRVCSARIMLSNCVYRKPAESHNVLLHFKTFPPHWIFLFLTRVASVLVWGQCIYGNVKRIMLCLASCLFNPYPLPPSQRSSTAASTRVMITKFDELAKSIKISKHHLQTPNFDMVWRCPGNQHNHPRIPTHISIS